MAEKVSVSGKSSSDESFVAYVFESQSGLQGYQFEPRRITEGQEESSSSSMSFEESERETAAEQQQGANRLADTATWCTCGCCSVIHLRRDKECRCCQAAASSRKFAAPSSADESICITNNGDFIVLCLSPVVLRNVLVGLNNVRGDRWTVNQPQNSGLRFAAYRQFTWWVHGKLGPGRRRVIPCCATHAIRQAFPKLPEEEYQGFHSGEDTDNEQN